MNATTAAFPTTVVTVTYGDRRELLRQVLDALPAQGVARVVVVNNGAFWPVKDELSTAYVNLVDVVEMDRNTGSAAGFAAGIARALDLGAEYLWLLDDDNRPTSDCLATLIEAYEDLRKEHHRDLVAVLAFRPDHQSDVAAGVATKHITPRKNSFRGFHLLDIPYKIWRRTPWGKPNIQHGLPARVHLDVAPYSGLFFHRAVVERFGLPRADFVLYVDDTEFTYRLTKAGGCIPLITSAVLDELESSWSQRQNSANSFRVLLHQGSDFRVYYSTRNQAYFETNCQPHDRMMFAVNRLFFFTLLTGYAFLTGRRTRLTLVRDAEHDGRTAQLGAHPRFPL